MELFELVCATIGCNCQFCVPQKPQESLGHSMCDFPRSLGKDG